MCCEHGETLRFLKRVQNFEFFSQVEKVHESIYCSKWYQISSVATKKKILFIMMMTQKEKGFSAGGFRNMNLETFADAITTAYSFSTFLLNVL